MSNPWESTTNLLCIRLDAIGDVLMTTPAFRALKQAAPGRRLTLLTSTRGVEVARLIPEIDAIIAYDPPWMKATPPRSDSRPEFTMVERLWQGQFDGAVIFTVFSQSPLPAALLCYLANIPLRLAHCHENPYQLLSHWVLDPEPGYGIRHEVRRQLELVATIGAQAEDEHLSLQVGDRAHATIRQHLKNLGLNPNQPWVVIHPGASAPSRRYPPEGFAEVARRLVLELGYPVIFTGTTAEGSLITQIQTLMGRPSHSLAGHLNLEQLAALIMHTPLLISNNTAPVHIAAAVGTPVVDLYALTNPQHTPWQVPHRVLYHDVPCKFCYKSLCPEGHHDCLRLVTPAAILQAVTELLDRPSTPPFPRSEQVLSTALSGTLGESAQQVWRSGVG